MKTSRTALVLITLTLARCTTSATDSGTDTGGDDDDDDSTCPERKDLKEANTIEIGPGFPPPYEVGEDNEDFWASATCLVTGVAEDKSVAMSERITLSCSPSPDDITWNIAELAEVRVPTGTMLAASANTGSELLVEYTTEQVGVFHPSYYHWLRISENNQAILWATLSPSLHPSNPLAEDNWYSGITLTKDLDVCSWQDGTVIDDFWECLLVQRYAININGTSITDRDGAHFNHLDQPYFAYNTFSLRTQLNEEACDEDDDWSGGNDHLYLSIAKMTEQHIASP